MKIQTTPSPINGKWVYQAQFNDAYSAKLAKGWLASRLCGEWKAEKANIYTSDLQVIFELRVHFDRCLTLIRQYQP